MFRNWTELDGWMGSERPRPVSLVTFTHGHLADMLSNPRLRFVCVWRKFSNCVACLPSVLVTRRPAMGGTAPRHLHSRIDLRKWVLYATRPILCILLQAALHKSYQRNILPACRQRNPTCARRWAAQKAARKESRANTRGEMLGRNKVAADIARTRRCGRRRHSDYFFGSCWASSGLISAALRFSR